jgi:periplasmic protein TonB
MAQTALNKLREPVWDIAPQHSAVAVQRPVASVSARPTSIVVWVFALHVAALYALHLGLSMRAQASAPPEVQPIEMIDIVAAEPAPLRAISAESPKQPEQTKAQPRVQSKHAQPKPLTPAQQVQPLPMATPTPVAAPQPALAATPQDDAPVASPAPAHLLSTTQSSQSAPSGASSAKPVAPAAAPVVKPSADADYLNNPAPPYPPLSRRLGEAGRVVLRVLVDAQGLAQEVRLERSSSFERLDAAALQVVPRWRFKPGTRAGSPEAMWVNVPLDFKLD